MDSQIEQLIQRGRTAFERRDYVAALADFREVQKDNPGFADVSHMMGLCLSFLGQLEEALEAFDRALEENPSYIEAHLNRAITLNELGRYEEARAAFDRASDQERVQGGRFAAAISARLANAHAELGDLYMAASAPEEASVQYWTALELRPRYLDIRNKLAYALIQLDELDQAETQLGVALEANPQFLAARLNLGLVHYRRGDIEAASAEWSRCRAQDPEHPQVRAYVAMLEQAEVPHDASGAAGTGGGASGSEPGGAAAADAADGADGADGAQTDDG